MPDKNPRQYGLDTERYSQVDDELRRAEDYFTRLRDEIKDKASPLARDGYTTRNCEMVIEAIQRLRFDLKREQDHRAINLPGHPS